MKTPAFAVRKCLVSIFCVGFAILCSASVFAAPSISPSLFTVSSSSTRAVALESVSMRAEPFSLNSEEFFSPADPRTRVTVFCTNLDFLACSQTRCLCANGVRARRDIGEYECAVAITLGVEVQSSLQRKLRARHD